MNRLRIETGDRTSFEPDSEIDVVVSWNLDTAPEAVELRLVWNTAGRGEADAAVVNTVRFEHPMPSGTRRARLVLPRYPYSFSGKLVSLVWALELVALPGEEAARLEITIAPEGHAVNGEHPPAVTESLQ